MGSKFSLLSVDVNTEVDVSQLADRLLSDPRVQALLTQHSELARSLSETHKDLAKSLAHDSHKLAQACEDLARALARDSRTLTNELSGLIRVLENESEMLGSAYWELGRTLTWATWAVSGTVVLCGLVHAYKTLREAMDRSQPCDRPIDESPQATVRELKGRGHSALVSGTKEEMVEVRIADGGGSLGYIVMVPLKALHTFSPVRKGGTL